MKHLLTILFLLMLCGSAVGDTTHVTATADNCLRYNSGTPAQNNWNNATDVNLYFGFHSSTSCYSYTLAFHPVLMKFDISGISGSHNVDSAFIYMYFASKSIRTGCDYEGVAIITSRIMNDWTEGTTNDAVQTGSVCWNAAKYYADSSCPGTEVTCWELGGADSVGVDRSDFYDTTVITGISNGTWVKIPIGDMVSEWHEGTYTNYGVRLSTYHADSTGRYGFRSSEYATASYRPYLKAWHSAYSYLTAPCSLKTTSWYSENFDSASYGYANPDTYSTPKYIDWSPELTCSSLVDSVVKVHIRVGTSAQGSNMWDSIIALNDTIYANERTPKVVYDSSNVLQDAIQYHWSIRLITTEDDTTNWSSDQTFKGISPAWYGGFKKRKRIRFGTDHTLLPINYPFQIPLPTGRNHVITSDGLFNGSIDGSQQMAEFRNYLYIGYISLDSDDIMNNYIVKYNAATDTWGSPVMVDSNVSSGADLHYNPVLIVGKDSCLHFIANGHNSQASYFVSDSSHAGNGINIATWGTAIDSACFIKSTYARLALDTSGDMYSTFRHRQYGHYDPETLIVSQDFTGYYCYAKNNWSGSAYDGWGDRQPIVYFWDFSDPDSNVSVYNGGMVIDSLNRMHLLISFWGYYGTRNKGLALAHVYSEQESGGYYIWKQYGSADTVGQLSLIDSGTVTTWSTTTLRDYGKGWTPDEWIGHCVRIVAGTGAGEWRRITGSDDSTLTTSVGWFNISSDSEYEIFDPINYDDLTMIATCQQPDSVYPPCVMTNSPTMIVRNGVTLISFGVDDYTDPNSGGRVEAPVIVGKWNESDSTWALDNLAGKTKFRAVNAGDLDSFTVKIADGTASGIMVMTSNEDKSSCTSHGISTATDTSGGTQVGLSSYYRGSKLTSDTSAVLDSAWMTIVASGDFRVKMAMYKESDSSFIDSTYWSGTLSSGQHDVRLAFVNGDSIYKDTAYYMMANAPTGTPSAYRKSTASTGHWYKSTSGQWPAKLEGQSLLANYYIVCGIKCATVFAPVDTFDNIDNPTELRDSVNTLDYIEIEWAGIVLPDTCGKTTLDSGGVGRHSYVELSATDDRCQSAWTYMNGGQMILDQSDLYVYATVKPDSGSDWYGGELFEWKCKDITATDYSDRWTGEFLSENSAYGLGRIAVIPYDFGGLRKQGVFGQGSDVVHTQFETYTGFNPNCNDVRIVVHYNNNGTTSALERHRVPADAVGRDTTHWYCQTNSTVAANAESPTNRVWFIYYDDDTVGTAPSNIDSIALHAESFELYGEYDKLNTLANWATSETGDSAAKIYATHNTDSCTYASTMKPWSGSHFVHQYYAQSCTLDMGTNVTNVELHVRVYQYTNINNNIRIFLEDETAGKHMGAGFNLTTNKMTRDFNGWADTSRQAYHRRYYDYRFIVDNSNGVSAFVNGDTLYYQIDTITVFDNLIIQSTGNADFFWDAVLELRWVANSEEITLGDVERRDQTLRRRKMLLSELDYIEIHQSYLSEKYGYMYVIDTNEMLGYIEFRQTHELSEPYPWR